MNGTARRIFLTVWLVYGAHFASNVVRETYLAVALGDELSLRVDAYEGLHPDLFRVAGRGVYINNNPGASFLGAIPYVVARPLIAALFAARPELARPKPPGAYDDPRPNRTRFFNEARARGVDVKLGLAAASMQVGLMAPLGALAAVFVFLFLRARLGERRARWLALLYAFGTPIFFRSAFLNQNAIVAHFVLFAFIAMLGFDPERRESVAGPRALVGVGALMGLALLTDYSAAPLALAFGVWILVEGWRADGPSRALRAGGWFVLGAAGPLLLLLAYQWRAFGDPWLPAQSYMPPTPLSVRGWHGITAPAPDLLWRNLLDPRFGLLAFSPMLAGALVAPFLRRRPGGPGRAGVVFALAATAALLLFASSIQFARLQFNTGVRYLVPAVPLLFMLLVPVLVRAPAAIRVLLVFPTVVVSWSVAMARESVPVSLAHVLFGGLELPWLTVLRKTAGSYAPYLADGVSPIPVFLVVGVLLWLLWREAPDPRAEVQVGTRLA